MGWFKLGKKGYEILAPKIAKNLTARRKTTDEMIEAVETARRTLLSLQQHSGPR